MSVVPYISYSMLFLSFLLFSILDAGAPNTVVATITTGVTPAGLALTPDNRFAYVANNNNYVLPNQDSVSVLNLTTNLVDHIITDTSFNQPYTVTINPSGTKAYVTNSNDTTVTIIDIATNVVIDTIDGFDGPSGFAITPDGNHAYVNNYGGPEGLGSGNGTTVRVVDLNTNSIVGAPITVGRAPAALAITPKGDFVYVINYVDGNPNTGTVSVIRTSDNIVVATIPGFSGPFGIAITPDGLFAYVTNFGSNNFFPFGDTVSVIDLSNNTVIKQISVGIQPSGVAVTPDNRFVYVTNYDTLYTDTTFSSLVAGQGTVNSIDRSTNTVVPPIIAVDQSPSAIAISSDGAFAYVTNFTSNTVNVIALPSCEITGQACSLTNIFLRKKYTVNKITWNASGTLLPISYSLYRDANLTDLIATIPATDPLQFLDYPILSNKQYTYYIVGINAHGIPSLPAVITVINSCFEQ